MVADSWLSQLWEESYRINALLSDFPLNQYLQHHVNGKFLMIKMPWSLNINSLAFEDIPKPQSWSPQCMRVPTLQGSRKHRHYKQTSPCFFVKIIFLQLKLVTFQSQRSNLTFVTKTQYPNRNHNSKIQDKLYLQPKKKKKRIVALEFSDLRMPSGSNGARHHSGAFCGRGP